MTVNRRTMLGTVGLGALVAACSGNAAPTTTTTVLTSEGGSATVSPQSVGLAPGDFPGAASCSLTPEETEGPYYFDVDAIRSDLREDRPGTLLRLGMLVQDASCAPVANAVVDIWHCDAGGVYSGFESASRGGPGGGRSDEETYLRGAQVTNADGIVEFRTVYPGWYRGRTVHLHFKVHLDKVTVLTSQLFFDEQVTDAVYATASYRDKGDRDVRNADDSIFDDALVLTTGADGDGYLGLMTVNVRAT